jgi:hypothetical protein
VSSSNHAAESGGITLFFVFVPVRAGEGGSGGDHGDCGGKEKEGEFAAHGMIL